jgi:hypothetical protein
MNATLKQQLIDANLGLTEGDFANHYSDLYVVARPGVAQWLKLNYRFYRNITTFISQPGSSWNGAGRLCFDIPFAHVAEEKVG